MEVVLTMVFWGPWWHKIETVLAGMEDTFEGHMHLNRDHES